jgi:LacI family transcriptional regulator
MAGDNRNTTIKDIAQLAGVSATTVSLCFQTNSRIGKKTREKVLKIANKLHYFPNTAARDLRSGKTRTIGFIINDIINPFYASMIRKSEQIASEKGYDVIIAENQWSPERAINIVHKMIKSRIEGIVLCFTERTKETYKLVKRSHLPHIAVDTIPDFYKGDYVLNDGNLTGYLAAKHLYEKGCRKIAIFNAQKAIGGFSSIESMENGFRSYFLEAGISFDNVDIINAGLTIISGENAYREMKKNGQLYDGIFCMNDLSAMGVINESMADRRKPGIDYAIIGVDNNEASDLRSISLSSMNIKYTEISEVATRFLIDRIENKTTSILHRVIPPELIVRNSTNNFGK